MIRPTLLAFALLSCACRPAVPKPTAEELLRTKLGIPPEAKTVVVFGQNAHLDIDWQHTFDDYYSSWVKDIFTEARTILDEQPRAFYSIAEMGYLQHHVELHPEELPALQAHAARGALHIVGGGVTSPDTLLPETELLLRDFLYGTRFSEDTLGIHPHAAWLPDSFGHAATAPDILAAAGFDSVGFSRIDGAPTSLLLLKFGPNGPPPPSGSTAAELRAAGSAAFVWRGPGGGEVLAYWMSSNIYCQGDDIDYRDDLLQVPGGHAGTFSDDPAFTDLQIGKYARSLAAVSTTTPYRFVPVGCDFQHPKPGLVAYLDGYNARQYPTTGIWAVAAPFDDFATLISAHRDALPRVEHELTPYFMGFYGTRPELKRRTREAAQPFFAAEIFAVALGDAATAPLAAASPSFSLLTRADHHDFITGTANDGVVAQEQLPLLDAAEASGQIAWAAIAGGLAQRIPAVTGASARVVIFNPAAQPRTEVLDVVVPGLVGPVHGVSGAAPVATELLSTQTDGAHLRLQLDTVPPLGWQTIDLLPGAVAPTAGVAVQQLDDAGQPALGAAVTRVVISNAHVRSVWTSQQGSFALASLQLDGVEALRDRSFTLTDYDDQGGQWRMGHEMPGCAFTPEVRAVTAETVALDISPLSVRVRFVGADAVREVRLDATDRGLQLALEAGARMATTRTVSWHFANAPGALLQTSLAGGFATREPEHVFTPTFWPAVDWASSGEWAVLLRQSTGVRLSPEGDLELVTARDARREQCDVEGPPDAVNSDSGTHRFEWMVTHVTSPADAAQQAQRFNRPLRPVLPGATSGEPLPAQSSLLSAEGDGVVTALKPADRGGGLIVRAVLMPGPVVIHLSPALSGLAATRTDAVERDLEELGPAGDTLTLDREHYGAIATVRLH